MALEEAVQRGRIPRNPVVLTQPPRAERSRRKLGWSLDEAQAFLVAASGHRLYAAFHLALVTGLGAARSSVCAGATSTSTPTGSTSSSS